MDRREFLRLGGAAGLTAVFGGAACARRLSASPASDARFPLASVGLQLYTVRGPMQRDVAGTLAQVAAAGYPIVETAGTAGLDAAAFRAMLDRAGLRSPSGHYALEQLDTNADALFATARTLGQEWIVVASVPRAARATLADYSTLAARFNRIGARCRDAGFRFAYHNHDAEFETFGSGAPAYDTLLAQTDPALVAFELDAYWAYKAGHDPVRYFRRFPGRFALCHVKDGTAAPERRMTDVGAGVIDFGALFDGSSTAGLRYAFVEHDQPTDAFASIRASHEHLARLLSPA